jgi:hypothetical protein
LKTQNQAVLTFTEPENDKIAVVCPFIECEEEITVFEKKEGSLQTSNVYRHWRNQHGCDN